MSSPTPPIDFDALKRSMAELKRLEAQRAELEQIQKQIARAEKLIEDNQNEVERLTARELQLRQAFSDRLDRMAEEVTSGR